MSGKVSPRYIGPFQILRRIGAVAYELALPPSHAQVHPVFHVSQLRRYVKDPSHYIDSTDLRLEKNLTYEEKPMQILDRKKKQLRS